MTVVVNFFGGPGVGKSTMAAGLFFEMKRAGHSVELITEYAKDLTWEERFGALSNQVRVFGEQLERLRRVCNKVTFAITDSPLMLSTIYAPPEYPPAWYPFVVETFNKFKNRNFFIRRGDRPYDPAGRNQSEGEAKVIDAKIEKTLFRYNLPFSVIHLDTLIRDDLLPLVTR